MNRAIVMRIGVGTLLLLVSGILGGGCGTVNRPPTAYTCDWCGQVFYIQHDPASVNSDSIYIVHPRGPFDVTTERVRAKTNLVKDELGHNFCSLKCQNAFLASKGVKEERNRVIIGE